MASIGLPRDFQTILKYVPWFHISSMYQSTLTPLSAKSMTLDKESSDFQIRCKGHIFNVHKVFLRTNSFFRKACQKSFKEGQQGFIELKDDSPEAVNALILYIYSGQYLGCNESGPGLKSLKSHAEIYVLAEKYDVNGLCDMAKRYMRGILHRDDWNPDGLRQALLPAACHVYNNTPATHKEVRKIMRDQILDHVDALFGDGAADAETNFELFQNCAELMKDFAIEVKKRALTKKENPEGSRNDPQAS